MLMKLMNKLWIVCFFVLFASGCFDLQTVQDKFSNFNLDEVSFDKDTYPVVVIGGGVGGLTSSIYLSLAGYKPLVIEGPNPGGLIVNARSVKNWPGEVDISGKDLIDKIRKQAVGNGVKLIAKKVVDVDFTKWPYLIRIKDISGGGKVEELKALSCIIAMGTTTKFLKVPGEKKYWGNGVSGCAVCDGSFYKDKVVGVVGSGDSAIEDVSYLSNIAKKVFIFSRRNALRATGKFKDDVISKSNVEVFYNSQIKEIKGDGKNIKSIVIFDNKNKQEKIVNIDGIFLALGGVPNTQIFKNQLKLNSQGYIVVKHGQGTSKKGIFAAGDIDKGKFKQAIIAAGEGAQASLQSISFLEKIGFNSKKIKLVEEKKVIKKESNLISIESEKQFDEIVKNSKLPVVIDFYADFCMPCRLMHPIYKEVAEKLASKAIFLKIDVSKLQNLASKYDVQSIPNFLFLNSKGEEVERIVGLTSFDEIKLVIDKLS
jgi:thioredoxin reductase (NADPH)